MERAEWLKQMRSKAEALYDHISPRYWEKYGIWVSETHVRYLLKFLGRMALRRNAYPGFFSDRGRWDYTKTLITGGPVEPFRKPSPGGYGPHLGFDYRRLEDFVREGFLAPGKLTAIERFFSGLKMNIVYVFKRAT